MAVLPILKYGNPLLRKKISKVTDFSSLQSFVKDMYDTMYEKEGVGLAANQVGKDLFLFIIDVTDVENEIDTGPILMVNANILEVSDEYEMEEGCLSLPDIRVQLSRAEKITIEFQDINQKTHTEQFSGLAARAVQHEIDHLNGKFITDHLSPARKFLLHKKLQEISKIGKSEKGINV